MSASFGRKTGSTFPYDALAFPQQRLPKRPSKRPCMYSHTTVGANDLARARLFYDAVFAPLGLEVRFSNESIVGWGLPGGRPQFLVVRPFDGGEPSVGNGAMIALLAPKRSVVDACYA